MNRNAKLHRNKPQEMDEPHESHRTRSKAAPDWTVEESLILVNEVCAVESEWGATLPSFQKWQQIVENCNALDVNRNLNQCKRKWDALLTAYRRVKQGAPPDRSFPVELFTAVDRCLTTNDGGEEAEEEKDDDDGDDDENVAAEEEKHVAMETDPDSDPEAQGHLPQFFFETGLKKQRPRMKRQKRSNPWGYFTSTMTRHEESTSIPEQAKDTNVVESMPDEMNAESEEQIMATMLWENAMQINAILEGNVADDEDYKSSDFKNAEAVEIDMARRKGDKLIDCLEKISTTLNQLCDIVQKCN